MTNDPLCFRRMTLKDVKQVITIEQDVYQYPWSERIFNDCIRVGYQCWLALRADEVVGHAVISVTAGESHMLNLSIARRHQRCGVGTRFIEFLIRQAQTLEAQTMLLEVRPSNTAAISCYNSAGFCEIGSRKDYYPTADGREDALLFARHITPRSEAFSS